MSLTVRIMNQLTKQTLTFKRLDSNYSFNSRGDATMGTYNTIISVIGSIQPYSSLDTKTGKAEFSSVENINNITDIGFVISRVSGIKVKDYLFDSNNKKFEIVRIADFGPQIPQEFYLKFVEEQD